MANWVDGMNECLNPLSHNTWVVMHFPLRTFISRCYFVHWTLSPYSLNRKFIVHSVCRHNPLVLLAGILQTQSMCLLIETPSIKHLTGDSSINSFVSNIENAGREDERERKKATEKILTKIYILQSSQSFIVPISCITMFYHCFRFLHRNTYIFRFTCIFRLL